MASPLLLQVIGFLTLVFAQSFPELLHTLSGPGIIFDFYSSRFYSVLFFVKLFVPETKGISLERIEANLGKGKKLRNLGIKVK